MNRMNKDKPVQFPGAPVFVMHSVSELFIWQLTMLRIVFYNDLCESFITEQSLYLFALHKKMYHASLLIVVFCLFSKNEIRQLKKNWRPKN